MKTVFIGAVEGSRIALEAMCLAGMPPALVVTLPRDRSGRHSDYVDLAPICRASAIPLHFTTETDSPETLAAIAAAEPDVTLVMGWSQICGRDLRSIARLGTLGFHPSALPRMRGRGVIPWTVLSGVTVSGATLFWLGDGADTGPIADQRTFPVDPDEETARSLYDKATGALAEMLPALLQRIARGELPAEPQDESMASVCARRRPRDGLIDWSRPAAEIHRLIRAVGPPYPGAFTSLEDGNRIVFLRSRIHPRDGYFIGMPGQVQAVGTTSFTVFCGDGRCIDIRDWNGIDRPPKVHSLLGQVPPCH